jgi:Flp pilus assembly protein TadG
MRRARRGSAAAEFGFTLPLLVLWVLGTLELGRMLELRQVAAAAAHDGARAAGRTDGPAGDPTADLISLAQSSALATLSDAGFPCGAGCSVTATVVSDSGVTWVDVEVTIPFTLWFTPRWAPASMGARASAPLRRQP